MKLYGHTTLLLNNKVVFEKKNDITHFVERATLDGNFHDQMLSSKIMPLTQWFDGCLLFDRNLTVANVLNTNMPVGSYEITAQASNDSYSGSNTKRGSKESGATKAISDGYQWSWSWTLTQGNGDIGAVALTRANNGAVPFALVYTDTTMNELLPVFEKMSNVITPQSSDATIQSITAAVNCIDYEKELAYVVDYDSNGGLGTVTIRSYKINTKRLHLEGYIGSVTSSTPVDEFVLDTNQALGNQWAFTYVGNKFFVYNTDVTTLTIVKIDADDGTFSVSNHDLSALGGVHGSGFTGGKDCIVMEYEETGGTVTTWNAFFGQKSGSPTKYVKADLLTDTAIKTYNRPEAGIANDHYSCLPCYVMPNGDFIRWARGHEIAPYYSKGDDTFYAVYLRNLDYGFEEVSGISGCGANGTAILKQSGSSNMTLVQPCRNISTINNLQSLVTKTPSDTMQLIYRIHEVEEE